MTSNEINHSTTSSPPQPALLAGAASRGPKQTRAVELLEFASLFPFVATKDDIEAERQYMEAYYQRQIAVHEINQITMSGTRCSRVTWACVD